MSISKTILKEHLVNNPSHSFWNDLEGAWLFDDGSGTTVTDYSTNGRDATISKSGIGDYSWDATAGQEHINFAWEFDGVPIDPESGLVKVLLSEALAVGDEASTLLFIVADKWARKANGTINGYMAPQIGSCAGWIRHDNYTLPNKFRCAYSADVAVDTETNATPYVLTHSGLDAEVFKNCESAGEATLSQLSAASDNVFQVGLVVAAGEANTVDMDVYAVLLWSRVLSDIEIEHICTALNGTNPWASVITPAPNADRAIRKALAILFQPAYVGEARNVTSPIGKATINMARSKAWISAGEPVGGDNVADGDVCLDTTNDDVYRYYDSAWDKINITT